MKIFPRRLVLAFGLLLDSVTYAAATAGTQLTVSISGGNSSSPLMYGVLFEDLYHSGDGGLYAEMIQNRAFQGTQVNNAPYQNIQHWHSIGNTQLALDTSLPTVSSALTAQMQVQFPTGATGQVGFYNDGFSGFNVTTTTRYAATFYLRGAYSGNVVAAFTRASGGAVLGSTTFGVSQQVSDGWKQYVQVFTVGSSAPDAANNFQLTFDASASSGKTLYVQMISVFQQTYKDRNNGLRMDLANGVAALTPRFLRFPGGNNLEGVHAPYYLRWNQTIGPIINRPLYPGTWGYINTNGFGLLEQLQWAIDMNMTPILAVWGGLYLDRTVIAQNQLQPYIDDALAELEFFLGPTSSPGGALRASLGYSSPFNIQYVEIGNEDFLKGGQSSYVNYRFSMFYNQIKAKYPNLNLISSVLFQNYPAPVPVGTIQDLHEYQTADTMVAKYGVYDHTSRSNPVLIGEYAATNDDSSPSAQLENPTLQSATSEAVYFCGLERNADVILGIAHGAMIKSLQDSPDNVALMKHSPTAVVYSYSYYVTKLFSNYYGTQTVPISSASPYGPLYWSGTKTSSGTYYIKVVNYKGAASSPISITIPGKTSTATLITLTGPNGASTNTLGSQTSLWTQTTVTPTNGVYSFTVQGTYFSAMLQVS